MLRRLWQWIHPRSNEDFADEVESHIAMEVDRLVASGISEQDAYAAARRAFGNPTAARERYHDARRSPLVDSLAQDIRYGVRGMRRNPGFTAVAVISLAIGIGANTTMFGTLDALLLRGPAHVVDANRIHRLYFEFPRAGETSIPNAYQGYRTYTAIRDDVPTFESVAAFWTTRVTSGRGASARSISSVAVTPSFFPLLGVRPALGRFFANDEELDDNNHVAIISTDLWRSNYGGDANPLGKTIDVRGAPYTIVGVAPDGFTGINVDRVDLWLPLGAARTLFSPDALQRQSGSHWLEIVGKRRVDGNREQIVSEVNAAFRNEWRDSHRYDEVYANVRTSLAPIQLGRGPTDNLTSRAAIWIAGVSLLVLLLAAVNVANLLLLRSLSRSREVAVRVSLGASRARLVQQWMVEGILLSVAAVTCAIVVAHWSAASVRAFLLPKAAPASILDVRVLVFTAIIGLGAGIVASLVPALLTAHRDFARLLGSGRGLGGPQRVALQRFLIGLQVALAMVLLVGAGLFVESFRRVRSVDLGLDVDHVLYANVDFGTWQTMVRDKSARADVNAKYAEMLEQVRRVPGVAHASMSAGSAFGSMSAMSIYRPGHTPEQGSTVPFFRAVASDYFETVGTTLVRGRLFNAGDHRPDAPVAIIDEATAKEFFPGGTGLESCVVMGSLPCVQIVGVVRNAARWDMIGDKGKMVYAPVETWDSDPITTIEIRSSGDPAALIPAIRQAIQSVSSDLPWVDIRPVRQDLDPQLRPRRISASIFTAFGILALGLAAVGLYGLLAYSVSQRAHEIGIRKALGAEDGGIARMVLRGALGVTLAGVAVGLVASFAAGRVLASQLYGVSPRDPVIFSISAASLIVVAIIAALAPVRRATRVDPVVTLRAD